MEMNTRLQVEHPVTEEVTGVDIVKEQIAVAAGEPLSFANCALSPRGHAIEFRINAEDPVTFQPSPGRIATFHPPGGLGVRVDTAAYQGYLIPPYYDSLIAKLIVSGRDRAEAIARGRRALDLFVVEGIKTTIPMHRRILEDPDFVEGKLTTRFMERFAQAS
jgi:acetyl-CoA carboxylase biotin carboxylase subunit